MPLIVRHKSQGKVVNGSFTNAQGLHIDESLDPTKWEVLEGEFNKRNNLVEVWNGYDWNLAKWLEVGEVESGFVVFVAMALMPTAPQLLLRYDHTTYTGYELAFGDVNKKITGFNFWEFVDFTHYDKEEGLPWTVIENGPLTWNVAWDKDGPIRTFVGGAVKTYNRLPDYQDRSSYIYLSDGVFGFNTEHDRVGNLGIPSIFYFENSYFTLENLPVGWKFRIKFFVQTSPTNVNIQILEAISDGVNPTQIDALRSQWLPGFVQGIDTVNAVQLAFPFSHVEVLDENDITIYTYTNAVYPGDVLELVDIQSLPFPRTDVNTGWREFKQEFNTEDSGFDGLSSTTRPDAIALDGKTDYCLGPIVNGDPSSGLLNKLWRVQFRDQSCYLKDLELGSEELLFNFDDEVRETSLAFDQNGRATVCWNSGGEDNVIYLYWFDPFLAEFTIAKFGSGRTPRLVLDNPEDVTQSTILLFYVNDLVDRVVYRAQSDRYANEAKTGIAAVQNLYILRARFTRNYRIQLVYGLHWPELGKWTIGSAASLLYPIPAGPDSFDVGHTTISGQLDVVFIVYDSDEVESIDFAHSTISVRNYDPLILYTFEHYLDVGHTSLIISNDIVIIEHDMYEVDSVDIIHSTITATNLVVIIEDTAEIEEINVEHSTISATCAVP